MLGVSRSIGPYAVLFRRCFIEAWEPGWRIPCGLYPSRLRYCPAREWRLCRLCRYPGCWKARQGLRARRKLRVAGCIANICNSGCASEVLPPVVPRGMTSVSYAVGPGNASQEYFSNISSVLGVLGVLSGRHKPLRGRCYLSNGAWITPPFCPSMRWVQPRFPEAPSGCRTDALRSGARRGGASVRRVPLRRRGGNMWRTLPLPL